MVTGTSLTWVNHIRPSDFASQPFKDTHKIFGFSNRPLYINVRQTGLRVSDDWLALADKRREGPATGHMSGIQLLLRTPLPAVWISGPPFRCTSASRYLLITLQINGKNKRTRANTIQIVENRCKVETSLASDSSPGRDAKDTIQEAILKAYRSQTTSR